MDIFKLAGLAVAIAAIVLVIKATGGYTLLVSGGAAIGSVGIPIPCPDGPGPGLYLTIKAVAMNPNGSSTAYYWGL
jgi:hypothetical protein